MDSLITPVHTGHLPGKIATSSGFSGFTVEQWMIWTIVYSPFALKGILPPRHKCGVSFPSPALCCVILLYTVLSF